ncbi:MAG: hypothetical protein ACRC7O_00410, partial [Fimbriiglobus sp.]
IAPLILDLGGRVNLATAGNRKGTGDTHASAMGLGPWEVNPLWVLNPAAVSSPTNTVPLLQLLSTASSTAFVTAGGPANVHGRYAAVTPTSAIPPPDTLTGQPYLARLAPNGATNFVVPKQYAGLDVGGGTGAPAQAVGTGTSPFPSFVNTRFYDSTNAGTFLQNHPGQISPAFQFAGTPTANQPRKFPADGLRWLNAKIGDRSENYARAEEARLLPSWLLASSTPTYDIGRPPYSPFNLPYAPASPTTFNPQNPGQVGITAGLPNDPANLIRLLTTTHSKSTHRPEMLVASSPTSSVRLGPIDLGRTLPDYRLDATLTWTPDSVYGPSGANAANQATQLRTATAARQNFARDVYVRLVATAGNILTPANLANVEFDGVNGYPKPVTPLGADQLKPYAQLAANIVDHIDADDIGTPFIWSPFFVAPAMNPYAVTATYFDPTSPTPTPFAKDEVPNHVVFGTELPRLVVNEAYAAVVNGRNDPFPVTMAIPAVASLPIRTMFWVELHNPLNNDSTLPAGGAARLHYKSGETGETTNQTASFSPYQVVILPKGGVATTAPQIGDLTGLDPKFSLVIGKNMADEYTYDPAAAVPADAKFTTAPLIEQFTVHPANGTVNDGTKTNVGYYVIGPQDNYPVTDAKASLRLPDPAANPPTPQPAMILVDSDPAPNGNNPDDLTAATSQEYAVILRRLVNPFLPHQDNPQAALYNPYITVDVFDQGVTPKDRVTNFGVGGTTPAPGVRAAPAGDDMAASSGRRHPYARTLTEPQGTTPVAPGSAPPNTFFSSNAGGAGMAGLDAPLRWLAHLDRAPVSPLELASVSAVSPTLLTQQFYQGAAYNQHTAEKLLLPGTVGGVTTFAGAAIPPGSPPLLYKALDFLATRPFSGQTAVGAPQVGRVNLNAIQHPSVLRALFDPNPSNAFSDADVTEYWNRFGTST